VIAALFVEESIALPDQTPVGSFVTVTIVKPLPVIFQILSQPSMPMVERRSLHFIRQEFKSLKALTNCDVCGSRLKDYIGGTRDVVARRLRIQILGFHGPE
jgi:hypothetical protein